jgi:glutamine phosphoribosylpyrophosphate amidotransferase
MCGVIGIHSKRANIDLVRSIFLETMIRGKHATGVTYIRDGKVNTIKEGIPADKFLEKYDFEEFVNEDGGMYMVGHIRYSTSDIRYNQPFSNNYMGIVHNGVLSQEPVDRWIYSTQTSNDSEMILRAFESGQHPLRVFTHKSMAVCAINRNKHLQAFRNHERPLWLSRVDEGFYFTSTKDIAKRSGLTNTTKCDMFVTYTVTESGMEEHEIEHDELYDLQ